MRTNLAAALELAKIGWAVFPLHTPSEGKPCDCGQVCASPAKHPRTRHGRNDGTTDTAQIVQWWTQWPSANVGACTGAESGIVVADIDPRHEGDVHWARICQEHGYLEHDGPLGLTGGGGFHYVFKYPGQNIPSRSGDIAPGIDVKGDGGYVVVAPSVHASGASYDWAEGCAPWERTPPVIMSWLRELMTRKQVFIPEGQPVPDLIPEGKRHPFLVSRAGSLRNRSFGEKAIFAALMEENLERCKPPMEPSEVAKIAASAAAWAPGEAILISSKRGQAPEAARVRREPKPFPVTDLQHEEFGEPMWAIPNVLPEGLALLAGKPKLGKSWMALNICIAIAEGGICFGELPVDGGETLMLALEDNKRRLKGRMKMLMASEPWPERLFVELEWPRTDEGGLTVLDAWLGQHPDCRLVVIDTHAKIKPRAAPGMKRGDIYAEDYASGEVLAELALRNHVCILVITHYNKGMQEDWINSIQGSAGVTGSSDTLLGLERPRGRASQQDPVLHVTGRDVAEDDYAMAFDGAVGRWTLIGDAADAKAARESSALTRALVECGRRPAKIEEIAALLGIQPSAAKMRLYRAVARGEVANHGGLFSLIGTENEALYISHSVTGVTGVTQGHLSNKVTPVTGNTSNIQKQFSFTNPQKRDISSQYVNKVPVTPQGNPMLPDVTASGYRGDSDPRKAPPAEPCPACGEMAWYWKAAGGWGCRSCL